MFGIIVVAVADLEAAVRLPAELIVVDLVAAIPVVIACWEPAFLRPESPLAVAVARECSTGLRGLMMDHK